MYANLRVTLLNECNNCPYAQFSKDYIVAQAMEAMNYTNKVGQPKYCRSMLGTDQLLMVTIPIAIQFKTKIFPVPVQIVFTRNMPNEPPAIFIELQPGTAINPSNQHINKDNRQIRTPKIVSWSSMTTMSAVLDEIRQSFTMVFPIYKTNGQAPTQGPMGQGPNPYARPMQPQQPGLMNQIGGALGRQMSFYGQPMGAQARGPAMTQQPMAQNMGMNQVRPGAPQFSGAFGGALNSAFNPMANNYNNMNLQSKVQNTGANNEEQLKNTIVEELKTKIIKKMMDEQKSIMKQTEVLNNYKNLFSTEIQKIDNIMCQNGAIQGQASNDIYNISNMVEQIKAYVEQSSGVTLNTTNCMNYVNVDSNGQLLINLIAALCYLDEIQLHVKKCFEAKIIDFLTAVRLMRSLSREHYVIRFRINKLLG